jgi:hypothetical protein
MVNCQHLPIGRFIAASIAVMVCCSAAQAAAPDFGRRVRPILSQYCYDCHGDGSHKGNIALDELKPDDGLAQTREAWWKVLKNVRAGVMPPPKKPQPSDAEKGLLADWIKYGAFGIDAQHPDPGRVTIRRLNRIEYRNTIRDLTGIDYNTTEEFPPDDTGYGFDTIGDALSVSPLLLEKYMQAAQTIVAAAVPAVARTVPEMILPGADFKDPDTLASGEKLSFYKDANVGAPFKAEVAGEYKLLVELRVKGSFDFDPGRCEVSLSVDRQQCWQQELAWQDGKRIPLDLPAKWSAGEHRLALRLRPLVAVPQQNTSVELQIASVRIQGPLDQKKWVASKQYRRFFAREDVPEGAEARRAYARAVLQAFASNAFRRPVDDRMLDRLVSMAEAAYQQPGASFEHGVSQAMVAILASPRFLFRVERSEPRSDGPYAPIDEYSLATRLSYFLWSTMPDAELIDLARRGELRKNLPAQVKRMLADPHSHSLVENFTGQWLEVRDVEGVSIDARSVLIRDAGQEKEFQRLVAEFRARQARAATQPAGTTQPANGGFKRSRLFQQPKVQLDTALRQAMRDEAEMLFASIMQEDRGIGDFIDCDYTFLNEKLAAHYGIAGVTGKQMRRVTLAPDGPRGGLLTMGAVLVVTSNPTRTSPVKRGQFILDNILGMPTPPPPADIPSLEESEKSDNGREPTLRETLAIHRQNALCSSCHGRMDPLGLSLENFNALGMWRESERGQKIDASGRLITGESFENVRDLKRILKTRHLSEFYRCLTEKMMTYALGRGTEYHDVEAVDRIVESLNKNDGRFSSLLMGIIESVPFQERRNGLAQPATQPAHRPEPEQRVQLQVQP